MASGKMASIHELIAYLTMLNDNIMVYVKEIYIGIEDNVKDYLMSNGLTYTEHSNGRWACKNISALTK